MKTALVSDLDAALDALMLGDFWPLMGEETHAWLTFAGERLERGTDQVMLRIEWEDPASGHQYFWLLFEAVDDHSITLPPTRALVPDRENMPDPALAIPEGYEHVPCFEYRVPSTLGPHGTAFD